MLLLVWRVLTPDSNISKWDCTGGHKHLLITREMITPDRFYSILLLKEKCFNIPIIKKMLFQLIKSENLYKLGRNILFYNCVINSCN